MFIEYATAVDLSKHMQNQEKCSSFKQHERRNLTSHSNYPNNLFVTNALNQANTLLTFSSEPSLSSRSLMIALKMISIVKIRYNLPHSFRLSRWRDREEAIPAFLAQKQADDSRSCPSDVRQFMIVKLSFPYRFGSFTRQKGHSHVYFCQNTRIFNLVK